MALLSVITRRTSLSAARFSRQWRPDICGTIRTAPRISTYSTSSPSAATVVEDSRERHVTGQRIHGFTIRRTQEVPELALHAVLLEHDVTGAEYLHVARADHNNVFGVAFRTPPQDSGGVAHILEHTVLCGSRKYPVRDPFFNMLNRSLSTFMNAMTSSDWTMYPFSTLNPKDYKNLLSVYLDAAFFPRLRNVDFRQEGIRLEAEDPKTPNSPIIFKGVVFNEMKGVFSNPENIFARKIHNYLLPSGTYSHESGGEPLEITKLTWEQLRNFHSSFYHPSNSRFFSYGDMPLETHLEIIQESTLKQFQKAHVNSSVNAEARWTKPREVTIEGPVNPLAPVDQQTTVAVAYLLPEILDPFESFCMSVVGKLLVSGPKAPFYKALLQSGLGSDYAPGTGFDGSIREGVFAVGLKNIEESDVQKVVEIIQSTFSEVVQSGFDVERVDAIIHEVELYLKHQTTSFGLHTFFGLISSWNHNADPIEHLKISQVVDKFRESVKDPQFLQNKVKEYFQANLHRLVLTMKANADFEKKIKEEEASLLSSRVAGIDSEKKTVLEKEALELLDEQNKKPDISCLPTLTVSDIEKELPRVEINKFTLGNVPVMRVTAPTNGVTYFRSLISTESLDKELLPFVPLFCTIASNMGAGAMDYRQLSQKIELKTGGLFVEEHVSQLYSSTEKFEQGIMFSSYCLDRNIHEMFGLWKEIFNRIRLDDLEQFSVLVKQNAAELAASLADSGHSYAMTFSGASLRPAAKLREQWDGISQVHLMRNVAESTDLNPLLDKMRSIATHVLTNGRMRCSLNSTPATRQGALDELGEFLSSITNSFETQNLVTDPSFLPTPRKTHLIFPFSVHYASRSFPIPPFSDEHYAASRLLAKVLTSKFLHREIREKGGAYGGGARVSLDGLFLFYSYRDPKSLETFDAFNRSVEWATKGAFTKQDLDEAKLSVFSEIDKPVSPGEQGRREFLYRIDDGLYQAHREALLAASKDQLVEAAREYLLEPAMSVSTMLGPENMEVAKTGWEIASGAGKTCPSKKNATLSSVK